MVKLLSRIIGLFAGAAFSPTWSLLNFVLGDYFDLTQALKGPQYFIAQYNHFNFLVALHPQEVIYGLLPKLVAIMIFSTLFAVGVCYITSYVTMTILEKLKHQYRLTFSQQS